MSQLASMLLSVGAVKFGRFKLASGKESDFYVDIKQASTEPKVLRIIGKEIAARLEGETRIAGMELGAVPIAVAASLASGLRYAIIRKGGRDHGTGKSIEGIIERGDRVLVVEDVATTGQSVLRAVRAVRDVGGVVERAIAVVDRDEGAAEPLAREGVKLEPLVRIAQLRNVQVSPG